MAKGRGGKKKKKGGSQKTKSAQAHPPPSTANPTAITEPTSEITTTPEPTKPVPPRNCHYVPQWVLRHFSRQERSKDVPQTRKEDMEIYYYSVETGTLTQRLAREVYAVGDLYRDPSNPRDVGRHIEIEEKLGRLEDSASRTVGMILREVEDRDAAGGRGTTPSLKLKRKYLDLLRKFLFVMYYHQLSIGYTYFQEDHPGNTKSRRWIEAYRARNNLLGSPQHVWLHVLRYYLETPHHEIVENGSKVERNMFIATAPTDMRSSSPQRLVRQWQDRISAMEVDPENDDWKCMGYFTQMQMFLAIWEAAPGEEFVMSDNSFGLYEGRTDSAGPLHKFFVVSPKIVLVLCHGGLKELNTSPGFVNLMNPFQLQHDDLSTSMLLNAPHKPAKVKYVNTPPSNITVLYGNPGALSPSPDDDFEFEISPLSPRDTHTVNAIILGNLPAKGKLTFGSRDAALRTLTHFTTNPCFLPTTKLKLAPLIRLLSPQNTPPTVRARYIASQTPPLGSLWSANLEIYRLLQDGGDADCIRFRQWKHLYHFMWPEDPAPTAASRRPARLVSTMDDRVAQFTFGVCEILMMRMGPDFRDEMVFGEQLVIAFLEHLVERHRGMLEELEQQVVSAVGGWSGGRIIEYIDVLPESGSVGVDIGGFAAVRGSSDVEAESRSEGVVKELDAASGSRVGAGADFVSGPRVNPAIIKKPSPSKPAAANINRTEATNRPEPKSIASSIPGSTQECIAPVKPRLGDGPTPVKKPMGFSEPMTPDQHPALSGSMAVAANPGGGEVSLTATKSRPTAQSEVEADINQETPRRNQLPVICCSTLIGCAVLYTVYLVVG